MVNKNKRRRLFCDTHDVEMNIFIDAIPDTSENIFQVYAMCPTCSWEVCQHCTEIDLNKLFYSSIKLGARTFIMKTLPTRSRKWRTPRREPMIPS